MFGDFILFIKNSWKEFWCIHNYKSDKQLINSPGPFMLSCTKCGRIK
jgi:hypothetical protein